MIWYLTWLIFIDFIFWPPEVIDIWRSRPSWSSEVKNGSQNRIGTPKNLWFDTSHDLFSLISYFDLRRSLIFGGHDLQDHLRLKRGLRMESEHQKIYDLTSHDLFTLLSYFDLFRGRYWREVKLEVGYMCRYQHMMYGLAKNVKHVWLT